MTELQKSLCFLWGDVVNNIVSNIKFEYVVDEKTKLCDNLRDSLLDLIINLLEFVISEHSNSYGINFVNFSKYLTYDIIFSDFFDMYFPNLIQKDELLEVRMRLFFRGTGLDKVLDCLNVELEQYTPYTQWVVVKAGGFIYITNGGDYRVLQWEQLNTVDGIYDQKLANAIRDVAEKYKENVDLETEPVIKRRRRTSYDPLVMSVGEYNDDATIRYTHPWYSDPTRPNGISTRRW
jgi:hypothetical protein